MLCPLACRLRISWWCGGFWRHSIRPSGMADHRSRQTVQCGENAGQLRSGAHGPRRQELIRPCANPARICLASRSSENETLASSQDRASEGQGTDVAVIFVRSGPLLPWSHASSLRSRPWWGGLTGRRQNAAPSRPKRPEADLQPLERIAGRLARQVLVASSGSNTIGLVRTN